MSPTPDLSAAALSPARIVRLILREGLQEHARAVPQPDKTVKIFFDSSVPMHFDEDVRLKETLAAEGMALGPDDEEGNFSVLGWLKARPLPVPDALLADTPEVQG